MNYLRQSTASQEILIGPFLDDTDGKTAETALTIANTDIKVWKHGGTTEASKNSGGATHIASGRYYAVLDATDTDTVGMLEVNVHVAGALPVRRVFQVLEEVVYDALFASSALGYVANAPVVLADGVAHGGTLGSSTATLALSRISVVSQSSNTAALTVTGNGTGNGATISSGSGATGTGLAVSSAATNGTAVTLAGVGTGNGLTATGGATGHGISAVGGATSGNGLNAAASTSGTGITAAGAGTSQAGIVATGGSTSSNGITATGGGTGSGAVFTSGAGASGDGVQMTAASTNGNGLKLTKTGSGVALASPTTDLVLPSGGLANVTAWTVDVTGSLSGSVGSVTGNVGGNVVGSVASIATGGITSGSFAANAITAAAIAADAIGASELAADAVAEIQSGLSTLTQANVSDAVWNAATASYGSAGSYGLLVETNLDAAVSSRLATSGYTAPLDAAGTRSAVGLASANLDTQLSAIAGYIDTEVAAILAAVDTEVGAIKAKTDGLTFTVAGVLDANVKRMNGVAVIGTGVSGDKWRA